jgi:hypothetical protein
MGKTIKAKHHGNGNPNIMGKGCKALQGIHVMD